jgi:hypothetical protein
MNLKRCAAAFVTVTVAVLATAGTAAAAPPAAVDRVLLPAVSSSTPIDLATADLSATEAALSARPDFGGLWVSDDNRLVVGLTGTLTTSRAADVRVAAPDGANVEVRRVARSFAQLMAQYKRASDRMNVLGASQIGVDVRTNAVEVVIDPANPAGAESRIEQDLGTGAVVVRRVGGATAAADRTSPYPHVRAGQRIVSGSEYCTAGLHFINSLNQYYMLTAGHCGNRSWREGTASGPSVGTTHANRFANNTTCDCAAVGPIRAAQATNLIYKTSSTSQPVIQTGYLAVNQTACYSGASTPTNPVKCGKVDRYPVSVRYTNFNNWIVKNLVAVQVNKIQPGDSGSPVYNNSITAVGIGVAYANSGDEWYYTSVQAALQTMSGSLLTFQPGTAP